ncbi:type III-B CRISPR module-associated protein Cmr3 [Thermoanaerobacter sp. RKWS2]|nr:type III-B CRISPR module-associated protein Cmr3 [Thermoanaerobacter sp. RKWS2]UZQ83702.1 type III-B CRISPR module-associated protein Cmr3 [Thermoanaerobacter sp. RKWS2]
MLFEVTPLDNVYFGKGYPFTAGFESVGRGVFPPAPSVFYGAFATYYLSLTGKSSQNLDFIQKNLKIKGVYYKSGESWYTLVPMDLVKNKEENEGNKLELLKLSELLIEFDLSDEQINLLYSINKAENVKGLIDDVTMRNYLKGIKENMFFTYFTDFVLNESKIGIKIDYDKRSNKKGYLYKINYVRMAKDTKNSLSFVVDIECDGFSFPESGLLKLGGEGKVAKIRRLTDIPEFLKEDFKEKIKEIITKTRKFKVVLVTPSVFQSGWKPDFSKWNIKVKLIAAAIGKPISIGGWDMREKSLKLCQRQFLLAVCTIMNY